MQTLHVYYPIFKKYNILYATFRIPGKKKKSTKKKYQITNFWSTTRKTTTKTK
jgi:hypothetical protein